MREPSAASTDDVSVGDLGNWDVATAAVEAIDAIVHVASLVAHRGAVEDWNASTIMERNVVATVNLFEAAARQGVKRIVLMSSAAVLTGYLIGYCALLRPPRHTLGTYIRYLSGFRKWWPANMHWSIKWWSLSLGRGLL